MRNGENLTRIIAFCLFGLVHRGWLRKNPGPDDYCFLGTNFYLICRIHTRAHKREEREKGRERGGIVFYTRECYNRNKLHFIRKSASSRRLIKDVRDRSAPDQEQAGSRLYLLLF